MPHRPRPSVMEMVSLKHHEWLPRITLEECRALLRLPMRTKP